ncbi:hypothetical protein [Ideonella sp. BN130291]|uniref:hypothetical protein n=1 Tax=Ideonella sp. BN130291 TaxID=3112940 RepID=UPI002E271171|nr:hypothetical protein [Ideonella sp. BN130291]
MAVRSIAVIGLALAGAAAQAAPAPTHAEFALCSPQYRVVVVADAPVSAREVAGDMQAQLRQLCPSLAQPLAPETAQRIVQELASARQQRLVDEKRLSIYLEAATN